MIILSFDIGIKNLAYCLMDTEDKCILDWNILDCSGTNETLRVIQELDNLEYLWIQLDQNIRKKDAPALEKNESKFRIICDYISGMTDRYASKLYKSIYE